MGQEPTITLSISESGSRLNSTYSFHIMLDDKVLASNQNLSFEDSKKVREISHSFGALFEQGCSPKKEAEAQKSLGKQLFNLWLAPSWEKIKAGVPVGSMRFLVIASDVPEVLNLPWEFLLPPDCDFLGVDPRFGIRRFPSSEKQLAPFTGYLRPRPLRLLFMACSPTDLPTLDYEREEEALFRAISGQNVAFDSCDKGTFEELKEKVSEFKPHIVHLTGHGAVIDGQGRFAFEKEDGKKDLVPSEDLRRFLAGSGVQCVFVSGCQSGKAPVEAIGGICQGLVSAEVPLAVGWAASIADDLATNFAKTFYKNLKDAQPVDRALLLARQEAWKVCQKRDDPSWTLPVLYSATNQRMIFDPDTQRPVEEPLRPAIVQDALPGMKEGYAEHFVGRRREQQRLLPALLIGDLQVVIITGMGGGGKSALATRLARKLETYGFIPIPVPSSKENPLNSARLLEAFGDAFRKAARKQRKMNASKADELAALAEDLDNGKLSLEGRLHDAIDALNEGRFLLLLDNFESNLDECDRHIQDVEISGFYQYMLGNLTGGSRVIITTRYPPSDMPALPPKAHREDLSDFAESSFLKILQRDLQVEQRIRSSELPMELLRDLYSKFGGTPRFLLQIREVVKEMDAKMLKVELEKIELPSDTKPGELQKIRDRYFDDIFTERLYGYLSPESQIALSRLAVYDVLVPLEGIGAVAGEPLEKISGFTRGWQDRAFAYPERDGKELWTVYRLLRGWLLDRLKLGERKAAHKAAGDFLYGLLQQGKEKSLGLSWLSCLQEVRIQYLQAEDFDQACVATSILSTFYINKGLYEYARNLSKHILKYKNHPRPMIVIGLTYLNQGDYAKATESFNRALSLAKNPISLDSLEALHGLACIDRRKGDYVSARKNLVEMLNICRKNGISKGEAAAIKELAMIDHDQGNLDEALNKFIKAMVIERNTGKKTVTPEILHNIGSIYTSKKEHDKALDFLIEALRMEQQNDDKHGEGMTFSSLGMEALWRNHLEEGLRLFALSKIILRSIEHVDLHEAEPIVSDLASRLNYTPEQLETIFRDTAESYRRDQGWGLIEAAFGKV